ncbi:MAG: hypothetical protein P8019_17005 [Gammaproteobacteria bacterium]
MANPNQMVVKMKVSTGQMQIVLETLRGIDGVDKLEQLTPARFRITYDVNQTGWARLREQLQAIGAYSQAGVFARWRDGVREMLEQNMRYNLNHKPACCSKPPAGGGLQSRSPRGR